MTAPHRDLVEHFAHHIASATYDQLPPAAREAAKKSILDTLGVILAASGMEPAVRGVIDLVREAGGQPEATVLAFGDRVPARGPPLPTAPWRTASTSTTRPPGGNTRPVPLCPLSSRSPSAAVGSLGGELITAVAVGQDVFARMRRNVGWRKDWNLSTVMGVFAATAATSHVLDLTEAQVAHALGIASMQSSGVMEVVAGPAATCAPCMPASPPTVPSSRRSWPRRA